jgi:hypothetical protein
VSKTRSVYLDPEGTRYGIPTWPWQMAPAGLVTRRQLAARGLRPGGQPVAGMVMWRSSHDVHNPGFAYLYRLDLAKPKRVPSAAQLAALGKAMAARRTCPKCSRDGGYVIPASTGICNRCAEDEYNEPRTCRECCQVKNYVIPARDNGVCNSCLDGRAVSGEAMRTGPADYQAADRIWL